MQRKDGKKYYHIRTSIFWLIVVIMAALIGLAYFRTDLYDLWLKSGGREDISFSGIESELKDIEKCLLCGDSDKSLMSYYRKFDTIGVISLNDWYVLDLGLKDYDGSGREITGTSGTCTNYGNTGGIIYMTESTPDRGMASMDITLPNDYNLDVGALQDNLCQECLDKVMDSVEYSKWKNEKKNPTPLCLVDFQTLEVYALQDWHRGCMIRDYWVEMDFEENENRIEIKAFYVEK